jgi:hypothetical protein
LIWIVSSTFRLSFLIINTNDRFMDTKDWFLVVGPLMGVLIGGAISSFAKFLELRALAHFELNKLRINKIEELSYELGILKNTISKCAEIVQVALDEGKVGKEIQDAYIPYYEHVSNSIEKIRVLQFNFEKSAKPEFESLRTAWNSLMAALYSTAFNDSRGDQLSNAVLEVRTRAQELQDVLATRTQSLLLKIFKA